MLSRSIQFGLVVAGLSGLAAMPAGAVEPEHAFFNAADGMRIAADYYPPPVAEREAAPMVILLHMYRSDRTAWEPLIAPLHDAGFAVLAIDLRGHGESATTETREAALKRDPGLFKKMQDDLRGAYDWLVLQPKVDRARFALVGASVGCSVALQYAAKDRSVDAIVCLSPGLNYMGLDSAGDLHQIVGRKLLLLATEEERDAPYTLKRETPGVQVHIYKGEKLHGTEMLGKAPDIEQEIVTFLKAGVGGPSNTIVQGSIEKNIYHPAGSGWVDKISPTNLRSYSSSQEAEARGLRASKSKGPPKQAPGGDDKGD